MTKTWLDKLCEPLEHPKYKQIIGRLIEYDVYDGSIVGKCAEGEIACQNNIKLDVAQRTLRSYQLEEIGVPNDLLRGLPHILNNLDGLDFDEKAQFDSIGEYIWMLNDHHFTYPQIVEFLRITFEDAV